MMKRRSFFLLVVTFFMFLYIGPVNFTPSYVPLAIPTEQNILSDEPQIGDLNRTQFGTTKYLGGGMYSYSTELGMKNTLSGDEWVSYVYDNVSNAVTFAGHTLTLTDWYAVFENATHVLIEDMRWTVEYWQTQAGGRWGELDLWDHSFLPAIQGDKYLIFGQHYTDGSSFLNVTYKITNNDEVKVALDFIPSEAHEYRVVWDSTGILTDPDVEPLPVNETLIFDSIQMNWGDVDVNATYEWSSGDKKCSVAFGSIILGAGERYILDPLVSPVMGGDGDDDWWHYDSNGPTYWTHKTADLQIYISEFLTDYWYVCQQRFSLEIPQGATIISANLTCYEDWDLTPATTNIYRINEVNVGDLEADASIPVADFSEHQTWSWDGVASEWNTENVTDLVQTQVNLGTWSSGYYIGFHHNTTTAGGSSWKFEGYQAAAEDHAYMNVTYSEGGANAVPSNDGCSLTNPDDTDNLYAEYREYVFTSNSSDADGFADIDYIELSLYSGGATWTVRYDEDTDTFSEQAGSSYIVLGGSSSASESGNDIDVTWYITIDWTHPDVTDYDLRLYTIDDEPESDTDDYDLNYDVETRLDITTGPTLDDGSGTADRGDYDTVSGISVSGTVDYYSSSLSPASDAVDVWVICADVAGSPWSDTTLTDGAFSLSVDSDDSVGLDTYSFKVVEEGAGSGGVDLCFSSESDTYIADRMVITIIADEDNVLNGTQVNFTVSVIYDYDDVSFDWWNITVTVDGAFFGVFNYSSTNFNDTDESTTNVYSVSTFNNETTHVITKFAVNTETVIWSAESNMTIYDDFWFYQLFLSTGIGGLIGPFALLIVGFALMTNKKYKPLGGLWIILELVVISQYFTLLESDVAYWWHIILLSLGVVVSIFQSLR